MSERRPIPRRKTSNTSMSSRSSYNEREKAAKLDQFKNECRGAYLSVVKSTSEPITSMCELSLALQCGGRNPSKKLLQKYWQSDMDSISYNEFCDIMQKEKPTSKETLLRAFKKIDVNGDGYITFDELSMLLTMRGERMTKAEVQTILNDADYNRDGKLDYNEFCDMLTTTSDECMKKNMTKFGVSNHDKTATATKSKVETKKSLKKSSISSIDSPVKISKIEIVEPTNLKMWTNVQSKGSFFIEEDGSIVSHYYRLVIPKETQIWLTIQPIPSRSALADLRLVDTELFIIDEKSGELVTFTAAKLGLSCSFYLDIFVMNTEPKLTAIGVDSREEEITKAIVSSVHKSGAKQNIKAMKDLFLYIYQSPIRCTLVIENQSHYDITLRVNCKDSRNCISHRGDLDFTLEVMSGTTE
ncbi:hypothetical protein QZH41_010599, partial [Actinostola sp. cb2023]